jgi:DNA-binding NarL/FixJ family response regulator
MPGGTLIVSRAENLFPYCRKRFLELGFTDVEATREEKDSLNMVINELKPRLVLMSSGFYHAATPYMAGQILKRFPKLNIATVSLGEFPDYIAAWFHFHHVKSYVNLWEGYEEFYRGLQIVRQGGEYISPGAQREIERFSEWPDTNEETTKRLMEVLVLLCDGFSPKDIGASLQISRNAVTYHLKRLYRIFHVKNREGMVGMAWELGLITKSDRCFYVRKKEDGPLPAWAAVRMDRKVSRHGNQNEKRNIPGGR